MADAGIDPSIEGAAPPGLPTGRHVQLPGRGTTFVREAAGPPGAPVLMLLHGLAATGGLNWFAAFQAMQARYRMVAMDHRGHGRGMRAPRFTLEDCADDAVALADLLGIQRFVTVGYSLGGPVAQLVWRRHRARVTGLVLCATARNFRGTRSAHLLTEAMPAMWVAAGVGPGGIARTASILWDRRRDESPLVRWAVDELRRTSPKMLIQAVQALSRFSSHEWIGHVDVPTAVVVTMRDRLVPPNRQLKLARAIPHATVHPVQGDHFVVGTSPSLFVPHFVEAVDGVVAEAQRHDEDAHPHYGRASGDSFGAGNGGGLADGE